MTNTSSEEKHSTLYRLLTHLMLFAASFFWGVNPMVMKLGLRELKPVPYNAMRLFFGVLIALTFLLISRSWQPLKKQDLPRFLLVSLLGFFIFQFCYALGVAATSASVSAIILGTLPINVALITRIFRIEHLSRIKVVGISATFFGVVLIALGKNSGLDLQGTYLWGVALLVISEIAYGVYTVFVRPLTQRYSVYQIVMVVMSISLFLFALYSLPVHGLEIYLSVSRLTLLSTVFSGTFALVIGNILWSTGIKRIGSTNTSVYANLPPVVGICAGLFFLNETLSLLQFTGAAVILLGVTLVNRRKS